MNCLKTVQSSTGLGLAQAKPLVESASPESPQLLPNVTGSDIETLTNAGCTVQGGVAGHNEVKQCSISEIPSSSLWVFLEGTSDGLGDNYAGNCLYGCPYFCAYSVNNDPALRGALYGISQ